MYFFSTSTNLRFIENKMLSKLLTSEERLCYLTSALSPSHKTVNVDMMTSTGRRTGQWGDVFGIETKLRYRANGCPPTPTYYIVLRSMTLE
jgi:hypothetical protein